MKSKHFSNALTLSVADVSQSLKN